MITVSVEQAQEKLVAITVARRGKSTQMRPDPVSDSPDYGPSRGGVVKLHPLPL